MQLRTRLFGSCLAYPWLLYTSYWWWGKQWGIGFCNVSTWVYNRINEREDGNRRGRHILKLACLFLLQNKHAPYSSHRLYASNGTVPVRLINHVWHGYCGGSCQRQYSTVSQTLRQTDNRHIVECSIYSKQTPVNTYLVIFQAKI